MEKAHNLFTSVEIKFKLFNFYLDGNYVDCKACIKILNALDLDEHGIQFLCVKEDGVSPRPGMPQFGDLNLAGLIEVKEYVTLGEMVRFFRALDVPFPGCFSFIAPFEDIQTWLASCVEKKGNPNTITMEQGGILVKKGTPTPPDFKSLLAEKRQCKWNLRHR